MDWLVQFQKLSFCKYKTEDWKVAMYVFQAHILGAVI